MKKRIVSFLMALVMAVSLLPVSAFAVGNEAVISVSANNQSFEVTQIGTTHFGDDEHDGGLYLVKVPSGTEKFQVTNSGKNNYLIEMDFCLGDGTNNEYTLDNATNEGFTDFIAELVSDGVIAVTDESAFADSTIRAGTIAYSNEADGAPVDILIVQEKAAGGSGNGPNNLSVPDEYEIVASYPAGYNDYISCDTYVVRVPLGTPSIKGITTNFEIASTECWNHDFDVDPDGVNCEITDSYDLKLHSTCIEPEPTVYIPWEKAELYQFYGVVYIGEDWKNDGILVYYFLADPDSGGEGDKTALVDLLATVADGNTNYYQSGDRYNAKTKNTSTKGFWTDFTAANGPRAKAQKALKTATTEAEINAAVTALQAAIDNLIPTTQLNPTRLYEAVKQGKGYTDEWFESFTENSVVKYKAKLAEAEDYLNSLFDDEGKPTKENVPGNQEKADGYASAVSRTLVSIEGLGQAQDHQKTVNALLKQYPMTANNGVYTEDSWNAFVDARDAAKEYFAKYPATEEGYSSIPDTPRYSKVTKNLLQAVYGLTPATKQITVTLIYTDDYHLRVPDSKKTDPAGNKPGTQKVTLTSGATIGDLMNQTGYTYREGWNSNNFEGVHLSVNKLIVNGVMLNGIIQPESAIPDISYVLRDGDVVQFVHTDWPSFAFNYIYRDAPNWVALGNQLKVMRFGGTSAQTAKTGEETTVTVEAASTHLWTYNGFYSAYAGAEIAVYGPRNEDGTYPEKAILTGKLTDAAGQASFKLYNEGVYLVTAFESHANDSNSGYYPSAVVAAPYLELTVTANEDGAGIKADLKAELDKVYKTYPESYFRPETWEKLKAAYDKAAEILTSTDSAVSAAYDAQKSAIKEIKGYQAATTAENEKTLTNFRTVLDKLPDNTSLITAGVKSTVDELIGCYEGMSDYQRKQLTGAEKAKYDKIKAFADANKTFPADQQYKLELKVVADTPEATAALNNMVTYLREHPAKMDRAEGGKYDHTKAINIVTPYTFGRYDNRTMLFSKTFSKIEPLTPVRLYTAIDYAAYFQTRNANGTFTVDGANWSISDEGLGIVTLVEGHAQTPGVYGTTGHLTVTVDGVVYGVKSITYEGLAKSDVTVGTQRVYDDSGYKGKSGDVVNVDISESYLGFTMPYNDVTVTITWAPVGDTLSTVKQAALSRLQELRSSLGDKAEAAYQDGVKAIAAAKTAAAVDKAYQAAVKDMQSAAASYGKVRVIVENKTFPKADWGKDTYWFGKAADEEIPLTANSTMMSCVVEALTRNHFTQTGAESNYISSISDPSGFKLAEFDGGGGSGWMGTLNDWFNNEGFGEFTVANGKLQDGDVIRIMYTRDLGVDLDGTWGNSNTTLQALKVQGGELMGEFTPGEPGGSYEYVLAIKGAGSVQLTPTASNKNYLTKMFLNEKVTSDTEGVSFYKRTQSIPVKDGDVIYIGCGEKAWPSMNKQGAEAREYTGTWYALRVVDVSKGASTVESMIDELPDVSGVKYGNYQLYVNAVAAARASFNALNSKQQKSVDPKKLAELEKLETVIAQFQAIDEVKDKLDKLPNAGSLTIKDQDAVKAAQKAYDKLTDEQKEYLSFAQIDKMKDLTSRMDEIIKENPTPTPTPGGNTSGGKKPSQSTGKDVKSGNTGDAGITLYLGMGLVAALAGAVIVTRKRKEN